MTWENVRDYLIFDYVHLKLESLKELLSERWTVCHYCKLASHLEDTKDLEKVIHYFQKAAPTVPKKAVHLDWMKTKYLAEKTAIYLDCLLKQEMADKLVVEMDLMF